MNLACQQRRSTPFLLFACLLFALLGGQALAFEAPTFQGDVLDEAGILSEADQDALRQRIKALREKDGIWAAIYIASGLQQESIEGAAVAVFEKWKLGEKGKDNGLLVMIVPRERKMRIEVGYGLEGTLTDAFSKRVIDEIYKPAFREKRYADGLMRGFGAMVRALGGDKPTGEPLQPGGPPDTLPQEEVDWSMAGVWFAIAFAANLLPMVPVARAVNRRRRNGRGRKRSLWQDMQLPLIIFVFLAVVFGLFFAVFIPTMGTDAVLPLALGNLLFSSVFGLPFLLRGRPSSSRRSTRSSSWGSESSSSSGSSSDTSDSSSSGGGSSGGGGASGDW